VEGDWSAAAFVLAAVAVAGGEAEMGPLDPSSSQGDRAVLSILAGAGLELRWAGDRLLARGPVADPLEANLIDAPDLFPALATVAACSPPGSRLWGLDHLVHKESDRLTVMVENLGRLGAETAFDGPCLEFRRNVTLDTHHRRQTTAAGDHRIAMAMAVAALAAGPLTIDDQTCVSKSFPSFWTVWDHLTDPSGR
jgi:3-phosphoshikimate 1-carboxyvinyltransferase